MVWGDPWSPQQRERDQERKRLWGIGCGVHYWAFTVEMLTSTLVSGEKYKLCWSWSTNNKFLAEPILGSSSDEILEIRLPCMCLDPFKWMHFSSFMGTAEAWFAVCLGFFWGARRRESSVFQVLHILTCLIGLAGWPGSRWTNGNYSESHSQGLSSCLVWTLWSERPPSSGKKVRCGLEPGDCSASITLVPTLEAMSGCVIPVE